MTRIDQQLNLMFRSIPASRQARALKADLRRDALEKLEEYQQEGLTREQAELRVVEELGDGGELAEMLPRTTSSQTLAFALSCLLALVALGTVMVYRLFFHMEMMLRFDLHFAAFSGLLLLPLGLTALGYALGYPLKKYWLRTIPIAVARGLLVLGAVLCAAYLLALLLYFFSVQPMGYLLIHWVGAKIIFFLAGFFLSLGIN